MIIRGTTPTETFVLHGADELDLTKCSQIWVTITDSYGIDHKWEKDRLTVDAQERTIDLTLTQEETLSFSVGTARIQLRFLYYDGSAFASKKGVTTEIEDVRKGGVIK